MLKIAALIAALALAAIAVFVGIAVLGGDDDETIGNKEQCFLDAEEMRFPEAARIRCRTLYGPADE